MSASEKLKALTTFDYLGPDANDMDGEAWGDSVDTDALASALPQIVAVVEAAEYAETFLRAILNPLPDGGRTEAEARLDAALAALEEALS